MSLILHIFSIIQWPLINQSTRLNQLMFRSTKFRGVSVICEFFPVFIEYSETWVEWNNCTQMATFHKRTCRKQINRGRLGVLNILTLFAAIWNANVMYILANKKSVEAPSSWFRSLCIYLNQNLRMDWHIFLSNFYVYEMLFFA